MILKQVIPIILTNSQSSATPAPFQHMFTYPVASNSLINSDCSNVRFHDINGNVITSWLEDTSGTWWLSLINGIPANSYVIIYMRIYDSSNFMFDGSSVGEAPQLSSTYGQYDNGANVFPFYDNFAGTTLSSKWTSTGGITYSVNNGFTATASGSYNDAITSSAGSIISAPSVIDFYGIIDASVIDCGAGSNNNVGTFIQTTGSNTFVQQHSNAGPSTNSGSITSLVTKEIYNLLIQSETSSTFSVNYGITVTPSTADAPVYPVPAMLISGNGSFSPAFFAQWYRTRAYPPNGVMPFQSYGNILFY